jgi:hypothetical protein
MIASSPRASIMRSPRTMPRPWTLRAELRGARGWGSRTTSMAPRILHLAVGKGLEATATQTRPPAFFAHDDGAGQRARHEPLAQALVPGHRTQRKHPVTHFGLPVDRTIVMRSHVEFQEQLGSPSCGTSAVYCESRGANQRHSCRSRNCSASSSTR